MAEIALDTSALMTPVELDVRLFDEIDRLIDDSAVVTPQAVLEELRRLADGGGEEATAARVGLDLATERCRIVDTTAADADDALVELAVEGRVEYVATNDRRLRDRVLESGTPVIGVRGKNTLAVSEP